ncbi:MAG: MipA/OmpV family protein [Alphaproteobacteria bacterium GM202ARS2]|nr:MipA/OmpV family protein [Alphaproteobacteria bacterium GM202ARS2]
MVRRCLLAVSMVLMLADEAHCSPEAASGANSELIKPLWEWGIGGATAYVPDYPASDSYQLRGLGIPYVIYRGDIVRVGDGGVRAMAVDDPTFELDLSLSGALNADSDDNEARRGMPDLDFLVGLGPQLLIDLTDKMARHHWDVRFQSRSIFAINFDRFKHQGFIFEPRLTYRGRDVFAKGHNVVVSLNVAFATSKLHRYFYEVPEPYALATRPAYRGKGGYFGTGLFLGNSLRPHPRWRLFVGARFGYYGRAANSDSPLFKAPWTYSLFFGLAWTIQESEETVMRP